MHQEAPSPKINSRKIFHMPKSFRRTGGRHYFCQVSQFQCLASVDSVVFFRARRQSRQCPRWHLAHCLSSLSRAPHGRLDRCKRRWRRVPPTPASSVMAEPPVAANRGPPCRTAPSGTAHTTRGLRVAVSFPVHAAAPSSWPGKHRARSLPPTCP